MAKSIFSREYAEMLKLMKERRQGACVTQVTMAKRLGMTQSAISKVERGERRFDVIELRKWCKIIDVSFVGFVRELDRRLGK